MPNNPDHSTDHTRPGDDLRDVRPDAAYIAIFGDRPTRFDPSLGDKTFTDAQGRANRWLQVFRDYGPISEDFPGAKEAQQAATDFYGPFGVGPVKVLSSANPRRSGRYLHFANEPGGTHLRPIKNGRVADPRVVVDLQARMIADAGHIFKPSELFPGNAVLATMNRAAQNGTLAD